MRTGPDFSPDSLLLSLREMPSPGELDSTLRARIQSRLAVSLVGLPPVTTGGSGASGAREIASPVGSSAPAGGVAAASSKGVILAWLTPVFIVGALSGIATDRWYISNRTPLIVSQTRTSRALPDLMPSPAPELKNAVVEDLPLERTTQAPSVVNPLVANPVMPSAEPANGLAAERQLLDAARTALARGEPSVGIASLEKHISRFPKGTLAEEREALYVRILVATGSDSGARSRGVNFQRRFPNSIFLPVVERAMESLSRRNHDAEPKP